MLRTLEATIDKNGKVTLVEAVALRSKQRALVTILDNSVSMNEEQDEMARFAESSLQDWNSKEEDRAWQHLSKLPSIDRSKNGRKARR